MWRRAIAVSVLRWVEQIYQARRCESTAFSVGVAACGRTSPSPTDRSPELRGSAYLSRWPAGRRPRIQWPFTWRQPNGSRRLLNFDLWRSVALLPCDMHRLEKKDQTIAEYSTNFKIDLSIDFRQKTNDSETDTTNFTVGQLLKTQRPLG